MSGPGEALARGDVLVLDGGVGSEIQRRGLRLDGCAWSGFSHLDRPDLVLDIHRDYIRAGARIITTNSFSSARHILEAAGRGDDFEAANRTAVELARRARDEVADDGVWIAGAVSTIPPMDAPASIPMGPHVADNYRRQADLLAEAGADLLVAEMVLDSEGAALLVDACLATGLPVWIGFSASRAGDGTLEAFRAPGKYAAMRREGFVEMLDNILTRPVAAAGVMHTKLACMDEALAALARRWRGTRMAYAETGRSGDAEWFFENVVSPAAYADAARGWIVKQGVQIVGGCCGTGPEHVRALARLTAALNAERSARAAGEAT